MGDSILHIRCGSDIRYALGRSELAGEFRSWGDPLCFGPVTSASATARREQRRIFLSTQWGTSEDEIDRRLELDNATLRELDRYDQVVLWFEHDPYDQLILADFLSRAPEHHGLQLICIDSFDGI